MTISASNLVSGTPTETLRAAITAAKAGRREEARELLLALLEQDEENIQAWLWLSGVMDDPEEQAICLENVLTLDPQNQAARKALDRLRVAQPAAPAPSPEPFPAAAPVSEPAAAPEPALHFEPEPLYDEPEPVESSDPGEFDDEFLCPYCAVPTRPEDRRCKACGQKLWVEVRRAQKRSVLLWIAIGLQVFNVLVTGGMVFMAAWLAGLYLQEMGTEETQGLAWLVYLCAGPIFLYQLGVLIGLYFRWKPVYYLYLVSAGFSLLSAVASFVSEGGVIGGAVNIAIGLGMFGLIFQLEDQFLGEKRRMVLQVDRNATGNAGMLMKSGQRYAGQKMWAMATLHFRRAALRAPAEIGYRLALVLGYLSLKWYDQAEKALAEAERISPGHAEIDKLRAELTRLRAVAPAPPKRKSKYRRLKA